MGSLRVVTIVLGGSVVSPTDSCGCDGSHRCCILNGRWRDEVQRFTFEKETAEHEEEGNKEASFGNGGNESAKSIKPDILTNHVDDTVVTLGPMEIRAFVLEVIYE